MKKLIVFDCDGTLVDSQHIITKAMNTAFDKHGYPSLQRERIRRVVGLSLVEAVGSLIPDEANDVHQRVAADYKASFQALRADPAHHEPLFPKADRVVRSLAETGYCLGMATGKSRRGVASILELHDWSGLFETLQTADDGPGKPHPAMLERAMAETGFAPGQTVMIGDTSFDMEMATAAGVRAIGVAWGYHTPEELVDSGAEIVLEDFDKLANALN